MANSTFSVFGGDIRIKGDVDASADLHIDGKVEGDVTCSSLVQGETGEIVGNPFGQGCRGHPRQDKALRLGAPDQSPFEGLRRQKSRSA